MGSLLHSRCDCPASARNLLRMLPRSSSHGPSKVFSPALLTTHSDIQTAFSKLGFPTVAFYKKYKAVHNQSLARRCPSAPSHSMAPAHSGFTSTLCSATGVTLSPAGVCVCYCMWSAVHAAVSAISSQQVELPQLQGLVAAGLQGTYLEYCPDGRGPPVLQNGESYVKPTNICLA
jgi:hypothetical protein